jgi:hypothetical protein
MGIDVVQVYRISRVLQVSKRCTGVQEFRSRTGVRGTGTGLIQLYWGSTGV